MERQHCSRGIVRFLIVALIGIACGCTAPLKKTPGDYRGLSYQRYQESPNQVYATAKRVITQQDMMWQIDSTNTVGDELYFDTRFSPVDVGTTDSLRLNVSIRKDKGTLLSLELQSSDSIDVLSNEAYKKFTKPVFDQLGKSLTLTTVDAYLADTEPEQVQHEDFLDRIGFFANADGGYSMRFNTYGTNSKLGSKAPVGVDYASKSVAVGDLHARLGLEGIQFAEFDYATKPGSKFQEQALTYNKDANYGLERYTYGIDLLPLWTLIFPTDKPGIHNFITRLLSARFRYVRELTQTSATVTEPSVKYPSLQSIDPGTSYSFRTKYRYKSASIPLFLFMGNRGHFNIGVANWKFSRTYGLTAPPEDGDQYIFDANVETVGPIMEFYFEVHESSLDTPIGRSGETIAEGWEGFRVDLFFGAGTEAGSRFDIEGGDYQQLLDDDNVSILNYNFELNMSYPIELLSSVNFLDVSLRIGGEANGFITYFNNYHGVSKSDWIFNPWGRLSIEFN